MLILILNILNILNFNILILILITFSILGKSSLILFNWWLPIAIEGPTPVSSLLHSSTIVVARIYLTIKFSYCFNFKFILILVLIRTLTSFYSRIFANSWKDFEKSCSVFNH